MPQTIYKGRFAPTPSGPAHLGTILAAIGSYLQARSMGGEWHIRIDDIDPPREVAGAADSILATLEKYGLEWDGAVVYQSQRHAAYETALQRLISSGQAYPCGCSRKDIESVAKAGPNGMIYPGTCRDGLSADKQPRAVRLRTEDQAITVADRVQGDYTLHIEQEVGDFVIRRADGLYAYHLATVVDDALDGFTEIVRGQDLLSITPQQIYLQQKLGYPTPDYMHLPLLVDANNKKLCKRFGAAAVDDMPQATVLGLIFSSLGLPVDDDILQTDHETRWQWAVSQWNLSTIPPAAQHATGV